MEQRQTRHLSDVGLACQAKWIMSVSIDNESCLLNVVTAGYDV